MIARILILTLLLVGSLGAAERKLSAAEADQLLERIQKNRPVEKTMTADFVEERHLRALQKPVVSRGTIHFLAPDKFRKQVTTDPQSLTVSNGKILWIYDPEFRIAEKYDLEATPGLRETMQSLSTGLQFRNINERFSWTALETDNGYRLELQPGNPELAKWAEKIILTLEDDLDLERSEIIAPGGERTITRFSNEQRVDADPGKFEFSAPADAKVTTPLGR